MCDESLEPLSLIFDFLILPDTHFDHIAIPNWLAVTGLRLGEALNLQCRDKSAPIANR
jgi:integrase